MLYPFELRARANHRLHFTRSWSDPKPAIASSHSQEPGKNRTGGRDAPRHGNEKMVGAIGFEPMTSTV
jgi:hypothetical protein